jgi:hypothetical protein
MTRPTKLALAAVAALACAPPRIPGTTIDDTKDTRAVIQVVQDYAGALQRKDAPAILDLVSPNYFDDGGTTDPTDDMDFGRLKETLPKDLAKLDTVRVDMVVRAVEVKGDEATVEIFSDDWYRVATPNGPVPRRDSDISRMRLVRAGQAWKITSGL